MREREIQSCRYDFLKGFKWEAIKQYICLVHFLKNGPFSASFSFTFGLFKRTVQILQQNDMKNVHPVTGAGI